MSSVLDDLIAGCFECTLQLRDLERVSDQQQQILSLALRSLQTERERLVAAIEQERSRLGEQKPPADVAAPKSASVDAISAAEIRRRLVDFYSVHNKEKVANVDKIMRHFDNRLNALNEALVIQYGTCIDIPQAPLSSNTHTPVSTSEHLHSLQVQLDLVQKMLNEAKLEFFLPKSKGFSFRGGDDVMLGIHHLWLDRIEGTVRVDLFSKHVPARKQGQPMLSIRTQSPLKVSASLIGLDVVRNVDLNSSDPQKAATHTRFDKLEMSAEVEFQLSFQFKHGHWTATPSFSFAFKKTKAKTGVSAPMIDSILKLALNNILPRIIRKSFEAHLPSEIGKMMLGADVPKDDQVGLATLLRIGLSGSPRAVHVKAPLGKIDKGGPVALPKAVTRLLQMSSEDSLVWAHLFRAMMHRFKQHPLPQFKGRSLGEALSRLGFSELHFTIENMVQLMHSLELVESVKPGFARRLASLLQQAINSVGAKLREKEKQGASSVSSPPPNPPQDFSAHPATTTNPSTHSSANANHPNHPTATANPSTHPSTSTTHHPPNPKASMSSALEAGAERALPNVEAFFERILQISRKVVEVSLDVEAIDLRLNSSQLLVWIQANLWRVAKHQSKVRNISLTKQLRQIHKIGAMARGYVKLVEAFCSKASLSVNGVFTGGKNPSYELSVNELASEGVSDIQISDFKVGGEMNTVLKWLKRLADVGKLDGREGEEEEVAVELMDPALLGVLHLKALQFYLLVNLRTKVDEYVVAHVSAKKDDPRNALSVIFDVPSMDLVNPTPERSLFEPHPTSTEDSLTSKTAAQLLQAVLHHTGKSGPVNVGDVSAYVTSPGGSSHVENMIGIMLKHRPKQTSTVHVGRAQMWVLIDVAQAAQNEGSDNESHATEEDTSSDEEA